MKRPLGRAAGGDSLSLASRSVFRDHRSPPAVCRERDRLQRNTRSSTRNNTRRCGRASRPTRGDKAGDGVPSLKTNGGRQGESRRWRLEAQLPRSRLPNGAAAEWRRTDERGQRTNYQCANQRGALQSELSSSSPQVLRPFGSRAVWQPRRSASAPFGIRAVATRRPRFLPAQPSPCFGCPRKVTSP